MIDRGISEEYVALWLDEADCALREHLERIMRGARLITRRGAGGRSMIQLYEDARLRMGPALAAEFLRRALTELAEPTPVDDSLPPPESPIWEHVFSSQQFLPYRAF